MNPARPAPAGPARAATLALLALLALAASGAGPALAVGNPLGNDVYAFVTGGSVHVQARYYDGLGSTKFGFMMFQGDGGRENDRIDPGAQCTEWHGTFTQVEVKAGGNENVASAAFRLAGFAAAAPLDAPATGDQPGFTFDALGAPGAFEGTLDVCDHPGSLGLVSFTGTLAPVFLAHAPANAGIVQIQEGA